MSFSFWIPAYAVYFCFISVYGLKDSVQEKEPLWFMVAEIVLALAAILGYVSYHLALWQEPLSGPWKLVFPILLSGYLALTYREVRAFDPDPELSEEENIWTHTIGTVIWLVSLCPILWFNGRLAFG